MKYIDVTLTLEPGMRGVDSEPAKTLEKDGWNASVWHLYSHAGTHMDAPVHFEVNNQTMDDFSPERFFTRCHVIDLAGIPKSAEIFVSDLREVKNKFQKGEGLIFRTGWSKLFNESAYRNEIPGISRELAEWCAAKGVNLIGVEPPSVADVNNLEKVTEIHRILLAGDVIIVEGLANLDQVTKPVVSLIVLPLKLKQGDGAPCRAIIVED